MRRIPFIYSALLAVAGCSEGRVAIETHPAGFVGQWVRARSDGTWGDTLTYQADGKVSGSAANPVPTSATWSIRTTDSGDRQLCARDAQVGQCHVIRVVGDTMISDFGSTSPTRFRKVRRP